MVLPAETLHKPNGEQLGTPIPDIITTSEIRKEQILHLVPPITDRGLEILRVAGAEVDEHHVFDEPRMSLLYANVYERRMVQLPRFRIDSGLRDSLIAHGFSLKDVVPTNVETAYLGGQWGITQGTVHLYQEFGPLVIATTPLRSPSLLDKAVAAYQGVDASTLAVGESRFDRAVKVAMGGMEVVKKIDRIPVATLYLSASEGELAEARYYPDAQVVVDEQGQLLTYKDSAGNQVPFMPNDQRKRETILWSKVM